MNRGTVEDYFALHKNIFMEMNIQDKPQLFLRYGMGRVSA